MFTKLFYIEKFEIPNKNMSKKIRFSEDCLWSETRIQQMSFESDRLYKHFTKVHKKESGGKYN